MGPKEFAGACLRERDLLLALYSDPSQETSVHKHLEAANLSPDQREHVTAALGGVVTDTLYNLLLALDGAASLGGQQRAFLLCDDDGNEIANGNGALEEAAWNAFFED